MPVLRPGPATMLGRGLLRHCPRCGGRGLFDGYFRLKDRCPRCGYRFAREEGFFTGVYLVNFGVTEGLMFVALMVFTIWSGVSDGGLALWPVITAGAIFAVVAPILFYPFATTIWAALDLAMRPLEPDEEAEAALHEADRAEHADRGSTSKT